MIFQRTSKIFFIIFKIRTMYNYHHLMLCVRSVLLTNMSNQAPQLPQTCHSPHHCGLTPFPTPGSRPETFHCPRNSSSHPIVDTHLVSPGVPFEIPYPICHEAIERGECHHHGKRDIVQSSSSNLRAHQSPFTIFQVQCHIVLRLLLIALHSLYLFLLLLSSIPSSKMSNILSPGLFLDLRLSEDYHN